MRKPTKPPPPPPPPQLPAKNPPPPLPPKSHLSYSLSRQSCYGTPASCGGGAVSCGGGSEYAESVCSMPTRLMHQPIHHVLSPASCHSCKSESAYGIEPMPRVCHCCQSPMYASPSCDGSSAYLSPVSSMQCMAQLCMPSFRTHSPCHRLSHGCHCHSLQSGTLNHCRTCTPSSTADLNKPLPPTPRERVARPVLSISPKPELRQEKLIGDSNNQNRSLDKCKPAHYRRHIEQHVVKIFNYLKCRDERRRLCEKEIYDRQLAHSENASTIMRMYAAKESRHLRSLRAPISKADFEVIKKLGAGNFGNVLLVQKKESLKDTLGPEQYAMKRLKKSQVFQQNHLAHVTAERDILAEADSEWIVKLYSSFQDDNYLYFILEYVPGGDMMSLLEYINVFPEDWASFYIAEISLALQFVHNKGFVHRDIKPDNILIDARGHIKLTDFGLCTGFRWTHDSKYYADDTFNPAQQNENIPLLGNGNFNGNGNEIEDHPTITKALTKREIEHSSRKRALSLVGSPNYIAPEVLQSAFSPLENANEKLCDWWSVGVILYEMVIGYCPFIDVRRLRDSNYDPRLDTPYQTQMRIIHWRDHLKFPSLNDPNGPPLIATPIKEHTELLIRGLLCDPNERLCRNGVSDIQNHPFFENIDWDNIRSMNACHIPERTDKFDTGHPHPDSHPSVPDNMFDYTNGTKMPLPDFTFKRFWQK